MGLSRLVVGVLSDNHHFHLVKRAEVKGVENQPSWRVTGGGLILLSHGICQLCEVRFRELCFQLFFPCRFYLYVHIVLFRFGFALLDSLLNTLEDHEEYGDNKEEGNGADDHTTDGADASEQSIAYMGPFEVSETSTIKAVAIKDGQRSTQAEATYTITDEPVIPQPDGSIEIALNNAFFGTSFGGAIKDYTDDLVGTKDGVSVTYSLGEGGANRYCNDSQIRLYQKNVLKVSVAQETIVGIEFTATGSKVLKADVGTMDGTTWTGNNQRIEFSVNDGNGNLQVTSIKVTIPASGPSSIDNVQTTTLSGQRVIYNLRGQRVTNPTRGIYILDGRKVVIGE